MRAPLGGVTNTSVRAGGTLEQVLEPVPTEELKEKESGETEKLINSPGFMCIRAVKTLVAG